SSHTAIWTGSEMLVWGGTTGPGYLNDGGRYNPTADSWTPVVVLVRVPPNKRERQTAVWKGSERIIWGGLYDSGGSGISLNTGGRYDPVANIWTAVPTTGSPSARSGHTAIWTGSEMLVWGGWAYGGASGLNDGGRYSPAANTWASLPIAGA